VDDQGGTKPKGESSGCPGAACGGQCICTVSAVNLASDSGRSYRPLPMQPSVTCRPERWRSAVRLVVLMATACSVLLAGCGRAEAQSSAGSHPHSVRPPGKSPKALQAPPVEQLAPQSQVADQVVSAWVAAESAFADAARTANRNAPELAATTINPQLAWSRALLERMSASGEIATGQSHYGTPRVIALVGHQATVRTCAWDEEITIFAASGRPAPGIPGQVDFELFTSTMEQTAAGWKLLSQIVGTGQCDRL
jgi:hypothetical protein